MNSVPLPLPFIVGAPRSGTTLLRLMLDSHPDLAIPHETHFLHHIFAEGLAPKRQQKVDWFYQTVTNHWSWPSLGLTSDKFRAALGELEPFTLAEGIRAFYRCYAAQHGKTRGGDKTPDYSELMREIENVLPEAHFIHLVRDGRDVAVSARQLWFGAGESVLDQARDWTDRVRLARWTGRQSQHYLEIRYETLVAQPEKTLRLLCEFLALPFSEAMLDYHKHAPTRLSEIKGWPANQIAADDLVKLHPRVDRPPLTDRIERWKAELTEQEIATFEFAAGRTLEEFGYRLSRPRAIVQRDPATNRVSGLLLTHDLPDQAFEHFRKMRAELDAMTVFIDVDRASPETCARA